VVTLAAIFPPTQPPERIVAVAAAADAAGLAELWVWEDCFSESGAPAVNADEDDADIERFAGFLAREVRPLLS